MPPQKLILPRFHLSFDSDKLHSTIYNKIQINDQQEAEKHNIPDRVSFFHRITEIRHNATQKDCKTRQHARLHNVHDHVDLVAVSEKISPSFSSSTSAAGLRKYSHPRQEAAYSQP